MILTKNSHCIEKLWITFQGMVLLLMSLFNNVPMTTISIHEATTITIYMNEPVEYLHRWLEWHRQATFWHLIALDASIQWCSWPRVKGECHAILWLWIGWQHGRRVIVFLRPTMQLCGCKNDDQKRGYYLYPRREMTFSHCLGLGGCHLSSDRRLYGHAQVT